MSERWVMKRMFKMQAVLIDWNDEVGRLGYEGPFLETGMDAGVLQFRWLLHPALGLPRQPFVLWRNRHPGGNPTVHELANLPDWEPIEIVGLPVDASWADSGYDLNQQGPPDNPLRPDEAAMRRLQLGAPRIGWTRLTLNGLPLPDWQPADLEAILRDTMESRLLSGIHAMLREQPNGRDHAAYVEREEDAGNHARLNPQLLLKQGPAAAGANEPARSEWRPLGLLLLSVGTDPLAALTLGFGTALNAEPDDLYMVSVRHEIQVGNVMTAFELADVVAVDRMLQAPDRPRGMAARLIGHNRPQVIDGPALETIGVSWDRPLNPVFSQTPANAAFPASYAVGRFGPEWARAEILLTRRPEHVGGWLPFTASKPDEARPVLFADHLVRESTLGGVMMADPQGVNCTYAVAAQDIFGRWGQWDLAPFQGANEAPQTPAVLEVKLAQSGKLTVDFAWDWSDRSPEFVELIGAFADDPGNRLFTTRVQFSGQAQAAPDANVVPLDGNRTVAANWGAAQDRNPLEPELRFYQLRTAIGVDFGGRPWRDFQVQARGQCHLHKVRGAAHFDPHFNVSAFGRAVSIRIYDPAPPPAPAVPEAPQWASLRDGAGISRALLAWDGNATVAGYVLYEATETTLLAALGLPGPDTSRPFTERLAVLRAANLAALRSVFRRVQKELIPPVAPKTTVEVALPRGSTVMHFYAVTAMSHNQIESAWPDNSKGFMAVATPQLAVPAPPSLEANPDFSALQPAVNLGIRTGAGAEVSQIELYRITNDQLAENVNTMGPPIAVLQAAGPEVTFRDAAITPSWKRLWYRAVAWSARDDLAGIVEARSAASAAASIVMPPSGTPDVIDVSVNEPLSTAAESLVSWSSHAPLPVTPLGPHTAVVEVRDAANSPVRLRVEARLDMLSSVSERAALPPPDPDARGIVRIATGTDYRLFTWIPRGADQTVHLTLKMIDPLGRIGSTSVDVPPLDPLAVHVLVPPWATKEEVLQGDDMGMDVLSAEALGLRVVFEIDQHHPGFDHEQVISISPPAGTLVNAGSTVVVRINLEG